MTFEEFDEFQEQLFDDCNRMKTTKGREYANSLNRFANFNRLAESLDLPNYKVGWVYCAKHIDSIVQAISTGQFQGRAEPIYSRFVDAIVYLTLIAGMIAEKYTDEMRQMPAGNSKRKSSHTDNKNPK